MKAWKKITLTALLACALVLLGTLALLIPASGSTANIYLMAVNERVLEATAENMPQMVGGELYVPYIMLSKQVNGINLGVSTLYSTTRRTVLVTDNQKGVIFDLQSNTAKDLNGAQVSVRAMVRNTMVFLPIDWLCQYFGSISCTRTRTPYGTLVRVTNSAAVLSDRDFVDAADSQLYSNLYRYQESVGPGQGSSPLPSGEVVPSEPPSGAELFLALRWGTAAQDCAQLLEGREQRGLFLFTPEELEAEGDLVRRVVGAGHTVGLALTGEDLKSCLAQAERGRGLLAEAARYNVLIVSAPNLGSRELDVLKEQGVVVWTTTVSGADFASGTALAHGLDSQNVNFVQIQCDAAGQALLRSALNVMEEENCQIYQATAPALA